MAEKENKNEYFGWYDGMNYWVWAGYARAQEGREYHANHGGSSSNHLPRHQVKNITMTIMRQPGNCTQFLTACKF